MIYPQNKSVGSIECVYSGRSPTRAEMVAHKLSSYMGVQEASERLVISGEKKKERRKTPEWKIEQIVKQFRRKKMMQFEIRKGVCKRCHHRPPYLGWDQWWDGASVTMTAWGRRARSGSEGQCPSQRREYPGSSGNGLSSWKICVRTLFSFQFIILVDWLWC